MKPGFGVERWDFLPLVHGGHVSENSLDVSTLQAAEPPYSVNNGPVKQIQKTGKWRVIYELGHCISNFIDSRKLYGSVGTTRGIVTFMTALPRELYYSTNR